MKNNSNGNRCGFNKHSFRQPILNENSKSPKFIRQIQELIKNNGIPGLNLRAERDEAVRALTIVLLDYCDLYTKQIGMPTSSGWLAFGWKKIMSQINWLSESRFWEALETIKKAGLFETNQRLTDSRYITRDRSKRSGYAISEKGFTKQFWISFREYKRWQHEANDKAKRVKEKATKIGKTLADFYKKTWCTTTKQSVKTLTAAALIKTDSKSISTLSSSAIKMQLTVKLIKLGIQTPDEMAAKLFEKYGENALNETEKLII